MKRPGLLIAAVVLAYGFYLLMTVIGLDASLSHKEDFTRPLQPLGWLGLLLLVYQTAQWCRRKADSPKAG